MSQIFLLCFKVTTFWLVLNLLHVILTKVLGERYNFFLSRNGFFVKFIQVQWHTNRFNGQQAALTRTGAAAKMTLWFTLGAYFGVLVMFSSILILAYTLINALSPEVEKSTAVITPVVPGVNLPTSQILPYLGTLLISGIFHEMGHALAAAREGVSLVGSGVFLFLIYPAAFVELNTSALRRCDAFQRLRITCAGVWHNGVMMVGAYSLWSALPFLLLLLGYRRQYGAVVSWVEPGSAMEGQLVSDTVVSRVNDCPVTDKRVWSECLWGVYSEPRRGRCVLDEVVGKLGAEEACCEEDVISAHSICFTSTSTPDTCLPVRPLLTHRTCARDSDCLGDGKCYLPHSREGYLLQITHSNSNKAALFIGDPAHLFYSITTSDYTARFLWRDLPNTLELFLMYVVSLSGALAIFNAVPGLYLDGQHMLDAFLDLVLGGYQPYKGWVMFVVMAASTGLVGVNVIVAFVSVCMMYQ